MKFVVLWIVHDVHWLAENCLTSQTLRLLFMHSAWTVAVTVKFVPKWVEKKKEQKNTNADANAEPKRDPNVKMLIGKLLTIHFQTWDPEKKWREISWVCTYFWSVVCYHSCILNSYSKFKERRHNFFLSFLSLPFLWNFLFLLFSPSIIIISLSLFLFHFSFLISSFIYICVLIFSFFLYFF